MRFSKHKIDKGDRYGKLVYTGNKTNKIEKGRWLYEFDCDCGKSLFLRLDSVASTRKNTRSCGCSSRNKGYNEVRDSIGEDYPYFVMLTMIKKSAKSREIEFDLILEDVKDIFLQQEGKCVYTGRDIIMPINHTYRAIHNIASPDRKDSYKGYTKDNIQFVHKLINFMKITMSHTEFLNTCLEVCLHNDMII